MRATSTSQSRENSKAYLKSPEQRLGKRTCQHTRSSIHRSSTRSRRAMADEDEFLTTSAQQWKAGQGGGHGNGQREGEARASRARMPAGEEEDTGAR